MCLYACVRACVSECACLCVSVFVCECVCVCVRIWVGVIARVYTSFLNVRAITLRMIRRADVSVLIRLRTSHLATKLLLLYFC